MSDLLWLGATAGLFALTLAYARLCDGAWLCRHPCSSPPPWPPPCSPIWWWRCCDPSVS